MNQNLLHNLPNEPGCYIFKDSKNNIIYVGKAKDIKKRVSSYVQKQGSYTKHLERKHLSDLTYDQKTLVLVSKIRHIDYIVTKNEVEALILENTLIKKHKPRYNIELKDSRTYAYIEQSKETFPRFNIYRPNKNKAKGKLYGPFTSGKARNDILQIVNKTFKLRTCAKLPKRACLRYHIGICSAPCINNISKTEYAKDVQSAAKVIKGDMKGVMKDIEEKMNAAAKREDYERALAFRDQITSLEYLEERQNVERKRTYNEDIINYTIQNNTVYLIIFNIYKGTLHNKQEFVFDVVKNPLEEFIKRYYTQHDIPQDIIIPHDIDPAIPEYLSHTREKKIGKKVQTIVPKKGEKKELLELVAKNVDISFFGETEKLMHLQKVLNLNETPDVIECFDISHLSGTNIVASMVQFRNAKPDKANYRRFKIKTVQQNDDFASMREVVRRRYTKLKLNNEPMPNLILIDGGIGQLNSAIEALDAIGLKIPIISLAKEFEEIYVPGKSQPIKLKHKDKGRLLLQYIRDEAHRFAITYNRLLRKKERFTRS